MRAVALSKPTFNFCRQSIIVQELDDPRSEIIRRMLNIWTSYGRRIGIGNESILKRAWNCRDRSVKCRLTTNAKGKYILSQVFVDGLFCIETLNCMVQYYFIQSTHKIVAGCDGCG